MQLHRLSCDNKAMQLNNGSTWIFYRDRSVVDVPFLERLWADERKQLEFLADLMVKLGIFGAYYDEIVDEDSEQPDPMYTVPSNRTTTFSKGCYEMSIDRVIKYLDIESISKDKCCKITFSFETFLPLGYYNRVVNKLITDWNRGYSKSNAPRLLPTATQLCFGPNHPFALLLSTSSEEGTRTSPSNIEVVTKEENTMKNILRHIRDAMDSINKIFHDGSLKYVENNENSIEGVVCEKMDQYYNTTYLVRTYDHLPIEERKTQYR
jgi:hypothetical protein